MDLLAHRETREILFDYETADSGGTLLLVGLGEHNENLSDRSVRDEGLGTVQDVVTVLLIRRRQDAGGVASRLGLRQAKAGYPLAARDLRQVLLLLLIVAELPDGDPAYYHVSSPGKGESRVQALSLIHISEPTRLGMISYA